MFKSVKFAIVGGFLLSCGTLATAQVTIVDTIGNGNGWTIGGNDTSARYLGIDPGTAQPRPKTSDKAGYVVVPFTISASVIGHISLLSLDLVGSVLAPTGTASTSNLGSFYGAIFTPNTGTGKSLSLGTQVGNFFQFDTSAAASPIDPNKGDGLVHVFSALNLKDSVGRLDPGKQYWLVVAPKAGLDAQDTDSLLQIGYISNRTLNQVKNAGASLTTDNGTMGQGYWEQAGARPGDALTLNRTASGTALYFGLRVTATPAPPALLTALMGALPMGGLLLRRRFAS